MLNRLRHKEFIGVLFFAILFVLASIWSSNYADFLKELISKQGIKGVFFYTLITALAVLVAPVSTLPLLPLAVVSWGPFLAAILSILGWTIGAILAFGVARMYGEPLVARFANLARVQKFAARIPEDNLFWIVVLSRIALPVDVLSYALGLFTKINWSVYFWATLLGLIPFAFVYAYFVIIPWYLQVSGMILLMLIFWFTYRKMNFQKTF